jgi:tetratricopeptide (TPR) repeat protein
MRWFTLAALVLLVAADPDAIERAVRDLGADDYATREKASAFLWKAGPPAEPSLRRALESGDAEVVARARDLLDKVLFGITPDTPKRLAALAARARSASASAWPGIVGELLEEGPDGLELARLITERQPDPARRAAFRRGIDKEGWQLARRLFADGQPDRATDYLSRSAAWSAAAAEKDYTVVRNFVAAVRLRGALDAELARWQAWAGGHTGVDGFLADGNPDAAAARVVVSFLAKAKGDRALQRTMAEASGVPELLEAARFDAGAWAELATGPPPNDRPFSLLQQPGLRMMYQHLAGAPEPSRGEFQKLAEQHRANDALALAAFRIFMYDRRPDDALKWLDGLASALPAIARAEVLAQRGRTAEAVEQLTRLTPPPVNRVPVANALARLLHHGGEADRLRKHVAVLARQRYEPHETTVASDFVEMLAGWGHVEAAADHAAAIFATRLPASLPDIFAKLHKPAPLAAEAWVTYCRAESPNEPWAAVLRRLPPLLDRRLTEPAGRAKVEAARAWARGQPPAEREKVLRGLAEACQLAGMTDTTVELLNEAAEFNAAAAQLQLGDALAEVGRWSDAATAYEKAWQAGKQSLALWLCGFAKTKAGDRAGADLQLRAHLIVPHDDVPRNTQVRDEQARTNFADELAKRAYLGEEVRNAVRIQRQLLVDLSVPASALGRNALSKQLTDKAYAEPAVAAAAGERMLLRMARTGSSFLRNEGYLTVLYRLHAARAMALLANDDMPAAMAAATDAHATLPLSPQLAADLVSELTRRGHTKSADDYYRTVAAALDKFLAEHPQSAQALADRAWLAARCRRDLDSALEWARRAVAANPHALWPREVLVEVHVQRKESDKAAEQVRLALERHPRDVKSTDMLRLKTGGR